MEIRNNILKTIGEILSYIFILSIFINPKFNMKLSYILLLLAAINYFFIKEKISINKKVYLYFLFLFVQGIITNFLSFEEGISYHIKENSKFFYVIPLFFFLTKKNNNQINYILNIGVLIFCFGILIKFPFYFTESISRQRGILLLGMIYLLIKSIEEILNGNWKEISIITFIISLITMVYTKSRMAIIVLVIILVIYFINYIMINKNYKKGIGIGVIILTISLIIYITFPQTYKLHLKTSFQTEKNSSNELRIIMWKAGYEILKEYPLFGIGNHPQRATDELVKYCETHEIDEKFKTSLVRKKEYSRLHNMYIDFFVQNGVFGIFYIILLLIVIPFEYFKSDKNKITTALFATILAFYLYGITWSVWSDYGVVQTLFQIILALFFISMNKKQEI